jgi:hypothetical protein
VEPLFAVEPEPVAPPVAAELPDPLVPGVEPDVVPSSHVSVAAFQVPPAFAHASGVATPGMGAASASPGAITANPTQPASTTAALRLPRRPLILAPHRSARPSPFGRHADASYGE